MRRLLDREVQAEPLAQVCGVQAEPMTVRIDVARKLTGISRSQLYELIRSGRLETVKVGRVNLIRYSSLKNLVGQ